MNVNVNMYIYMYIALGVRMDSYLNGCAILWELCYLDGCLHIKSRFKNFFVELFTKILLYKSTIIYVNTLK